MKIEDNIDQLLSAKMHDCEVEAPQGLWEAIQSDLPKQLANDGGVSSKVVSAIKSASLGVKTMVLTSALAVGGISIYVLQQKVDAPPTASVSTAPSPNFGLNQTLNVTEEVKEANKTKLPLVQTEKVKPVKPTPIESEKNVPVKSVVENELNKSETDGPVSISIPMVVKPDLEQKKLEEKAEIEHIIDEQLQIIKDEEPARKEDFTEKRQPKYTNTFSPNGDGKNDTWFIDIEELSDFQLKIYKANGELVFETLDYKEHWNGDNIKNGAMCEPGVYIFVLHYRYENETKFNTKNGTIQLFR